MNHTLVANTFPPGCVVRTSRGEVRVEEYRGLDRQGLPIYAVTGAKGEKWLAMIMPTLTITGYDPARMPVTKCVHESITTPDGNGVFCLLCGETLA